MNLIDGLRLKKLIFPTGKDVNMANTKMQLLRTTEELIKAYMQYDYRGGYPKTLSYSELLDPLINIKHSVAVKYLLNFKKKMPTIRSFIVKDYDGVMHLVFTNDCISYYDTFDDHYKLYGPIFLIRREKWLEFEEIDFSDK